MIETIKLTCPCGATFERNCSTYINKGGIPNAAKMVFIAELRAAEWLELHKVCLSKVPSNPPPT